MATPVFGIVGRKNAGKTTLVARLVRHLSDAGLRVSTVKHAHHALDVDREGTDSWKHREAGAREVALIGANRWALMHELRGSAEPSLDEMLAIMSPADLILVEGFKGGAHPKLEVLAGPDRLDPSVCPNVVAVAGPGAPFDRDDVAGIGRFILQHVGLRVGT